MPDIEDPINSLIQTTKTMYAEGNAQQYEAEIQPLNFGGEWGTSTPTKPSVSAPSSNNNNVEVSKLYEAIAALTEKVESLTKSSSESTQFNESSLVDTPAEEVIDTENTAPELTSVEVLEADQVEVVSTENQSTEKELEVEDIKLSEDEILPATKPNVKETQKLSHYMPMGKPPSSYGPAICCFRCSYYQGSYENGIYGHCQKHDFPSSLHYKCSDYVPYGSDKVE